MVFSLRPGARRDRIIKEKENAARSQDLAAFFYIQVGRHWPAKA
jgi:hypothetical protein